MPVDLDQLFQAPLSEFTRMRNALAKAAGKNGAEIKTLPRPTLAAWAVNQLYWKDRPRHDALIEAANEMRRTHKAVIEGKRGDLRGAGREHEAALDAALKATVGLLEDSGSPVTDATRQAIFNTLRALPSDEPPGRLTRTLAPGGFEMLAGVSPARGPKRQAGTSTNTKPADARAGTRGKTTDTDAERQASRAREQRVAAERAVRDADQHARRAEFEAARASREVTRTERRLEEARRAFDEATAELQTAEREAKRAHKAHETAERRAQDANATLDAAKAKL